MRVLFSRVSITLALTLATSPVLLADYTYQETTQLTGGTMLNMMKMVGHFSSQARKAGEPIVSTVYLKGNRMATVNADTIEIVDLDKETITHVDTLKKTYTVMTFDQMKQQIENARKEMEKKQAEHPASAPESKQNPDDVKVSFDVKVRKTGAEKPVNGLPSKETILTMTMNATDQKTQQTGGVMAVTNDMWMVPEVPGYDQVRDFHKRMAEKLASATHGLGLDFTRALAQNPGATEALADMGKEMQKIEGVPIQQIMRMGMTTDGKPLPAASEAPLPPDNSPAMPSAGDVAKQGAASMISSHIPFGGFGKKKQQNDPPPADPNAGQKGNAPPPTSAILMESQTTVSSFSSAPVEDSHFEVPAGFKQVQAQTEKQ